LKRARKQLARYPGVNAWAKTLRASPLKRASGVPFMNNAGCASEGVHAADLKRQRIRLALHQDNVPGAYLLA